MQKKLTPSDSLTGLVLKRALDTASSQTGLKLQPLVNDKQEAAVEPIAVASLWVDRDNNCLKLQLVGSNESINAWIRWHLFRLLIKHRNLLHETNSLEVLATQLGEGKLTVTLEMPKQLNKVFNREYFRVELDQRLSLPVTLHLDGLNITGALEDFSAGGCRVSLSPQLALHFILPIHQALRCTVTFPNGEQLNLPFEMSYLKPQEDFTCALLGCHFQHASAADEKACMRYSFEIEREIARLSNVQRTVKQQSPLFESSDKKAAKQTPPNAELSPLNRLLIPQNYASKIQVLADQLALQVLLLALSKKLEPNKLKPLAIDFIEALEANENAARLALQQPNASINPVILHTMRVISHAYPLVFKIGISNSLSLPVMMSLLLHDLGKLFVSKQPCFNPLKLMPDNLRLLKQHQIQLLRAAGALRWIPPTIGESLMVNANERLDGSGYPRGLGQEKLDSLSRLVSVCKVLDCLVHGYNDPAMRWRDAYKWVHRHQHWFDLPMLQVFIKRYGLRPLNTQVVYSSGYLAQVTEVDKQGEIVEVVLLKSVNHPASVIEGRRVAGAAELAKLGSIKSTLGINSTAN